MKLEEVELKQRTKLEYMSLPPDETVTWKHRCSDFFLLAHVMQLIEPDKMH